ncbi:MAG: hypothetical protein C4570_02125 [Ammonifex sp.]|nr:MAG: hypothetical protein C4570_02125 [Ammonifex sp.]
MFSERPCPKCNGDMVKDEAYFGLRCPFCGHYISDWKTKSKWRRRRKSKKELAEKWRGRRILAFRAKRKLEDR